MIESGYYPPGAEFAANAPWNEKRVPQRNFNVSVSQVLSKSTQVVTDDYTLEFDKEDKSTYVDTSDTDWKSAYSGDGHFTPLELIELFKEHLEKHLPDPVIDVMGYKKAKNLIAECEGWTEDETEFIGE